MQPSPLTAIYVRMEPAPAPACDEYRRAFLRGRRRPSRFRRRAAAAQP